MKKEGVFITFEGGDGAGKTTLIEKVYHDLEQRKLRVLKTRAPGGTSIGKEIRHLLLHKHDVPLSKRGELLLFLADRAQHVDELILPALKQGNIVLCDRFNDSTVAYQGGARGFKTDWVETLCAFASHGLVPNLTFYLDLDPQIAFKRHLREKDRLESESFSFHQKIRRAFKQIAKREPKRLIVIDAAQSPEEVYNQAKHAIDALLKTYRQ